MGEMFDTRPTLLTKNVIACFMRSERSGMKIPGHTFAMLKESITLWVLRDISVSTWLKASLKGKVFNSSGSSVDTPWPEIGLEEKPSVFEVQWRGKDGQKYNLFLRGSETTSTYRWLRIVKVLLLLTVSVTILVLRFVRE